MKKQWLTILLSVLLSVLLCVCTVLPVCAASDDSNGDWAEQSVILTNTAEAELSVRVGDIDALNDESAVEADYDPFTARSQYSHDYPWNAQSGDPAGTDRIFVGSAWNSSICDGYSTYYCDHVSGSDTENAYGDGALRITMEYDASGVRVKNALLQLCIDDFQARSWYSNFTVTLNGKDAPFLAELLNHVDQTGPTSYIISSIIPPSFYPDIASGTLEIVIDETTGIGDGYAVDFAKLLVNYDDSVFTGVFKGTTLPGATVRLLGTSTTVTASADGGFEFRAVPGLNAVRGSMEGYVESYDSGIVLADGLNADGEEDIWEAYLELTGGVGNPDIDFSAFSATEAWETASSWATAELAEAQHLGLIPGCLLRADMTQNITRAEFAAVSVRVYEALTGKTAVLPEDFVNPFTDCDDPEVLKAYALDITRGTGDGTTFSPDDILNREQAATMLTRVYKKYAFEGWTYADDGKFALDYAMPERFADDEQISPWACDSVYFMASNGVILGSDGKFMPRAVTAAEKAIGYANATREQALLIAVRMTKKLG